MAPTATVVEADAVGKSLPRSAADKAPASAPFPRKLPSQPTTVIDHDKSELPLPLNLKTKEQIVLTQGQGYKELAVYPGKLGLALAFRTNVIGAVVRAVDPACTFKNIIYIGDRIVSIDGRKLTSVSDLQVGKNRLRVFGIVREATAAPACAPASFSTPNNQIEANNIGIGASTNTDKYNHPLSLLLPPKPKRQETNNNNHPSSKKRNREPPRYYSPPEPTPRKRKQTPKTTKEEIEIEEVAPPDLLHTWANSTRNDMQNREEFYTWLQEWNKYQKDQVSHHNARHADGWERRYAELARYQKENDNGDCNNVPLHYRDPDDLTLGEWAELQREHFAGGKLDEERANRLTELGFDFEHIPHHDRDNESSTNSTGGDDYFSKKVKKLLEYKQKHQNCDVPITYPVETLGVWAHKQRDAYNEGTIDEKRHALLEGEGFVFEPGTNVKISVLKPIWKKTYEELVQFKRDHGHFEVPSNYQATDMSSRLDSWLVKQRKLYKNKELSRNHIRLFADIGLDLEARKASYNDGKWNHNFDQLLSYKDEMGHCNVKQKGKLSTLGRWVGLQRENFKKGKLSGERNKRLLAIGFEFDPWNKSDEEDEDDDIPTKQDPVFDSIAWISNYEALKIFVEKNGHADVPPEYRDDNVKGSLHTWIRTQKGFFEEDRLPKDREDVLAELGVDFSNYEKSTMVHSDQMWMRKFETLKQFNEDRGHMRVPESYLSKDSYGTFYLASWLQGQRSNYRKKKLSAEKVFMLENLGLDWDPREKKAPPKEPTEEKTPQKKPTEKKTPEKPTQQVCYQKSILDQFDPPLGDMPDDNLWYEHDDCIQRRVPSSWQCPQLCLEEMYVMYHCQHIYLDKQTKISPLKRLEDSDMVGDNTSSIAKEKIFHVKHLSALIDQECRNKGVAVEGVMSEEQARQCVRMGYPCLNIPSTFFNGQPRDILRGMSLSAIYRRKNTEVEGELGEA